MDGTTALLAHIIFPHSPRLWYVHFNVGKKSIDNTIHLMLRIPIKNLHGLEVIYWAVS